MTCPQCGALRPELIFSDGDTWGYRCHSCTYLWTQEGA